MVEEKKGEINEKNEFAGVGGVKIKEVQLGYIH
jgi:hypothetical protein